MKDRGEKRRAVEGAPRFECPEDFRACAFAPGAPFTPEALRDPSKKLVLIRAPPDFSPESLDGRLLPLRGCQNIKVPQPDGTQKVYSVQTAQGHPGSGAHLLVPSGRLDDLTCAPSISSCLSIWERHGDPGADQPLFPVAARPAPHIPEGLKQRFLPFGGQLKRPRPPWEAPAEPPQRKKKKKKGHRHRPGGSDGERPELEQEPCVDQSPETPSREPVMLAAGDVNGEQQEAAAEEEGEVLCDGAQRPQPPEQDSLPTRSLGASSQEGSLAGEEQSHRKKKKKRKDKSGEETAAEEAPALYPVEPSPELLPQWPGELEAQAGGCGSPEAEALVPHKAKKRRRKRGEEEAAEEEGGVAELLAAGAVKEEAPWQLGALGRDPEEGEPGLECSSSTAKKSKKKRRGEPAEAEQGGGTLLLEPCIPKQEPGGWDEGLGLGQGELLGPPAEGLSPTPKKKKKKKKHKEESAEEGPGLVKEELIYSQE
uniref:DNA-directed RNA polymerase I subunit RPA34 n=1 Tax=Salvator merianae TaxID=96440 RepID=A0A8D0DSS9_SALMN